MIEDPLRHICRLVGTNVRPETKLEDIGFDSLEWLEFYQELNIEREHISDFETVGQVVAHLTARAAQ